MCLEKLQKLIEDKGKSKILPVKNTQNSKMKVYSFKNEKIKQDFNNHVK